MNIKELLLLVSRASRGYDSIRRAAIGFKGYGFLFRDFEDSKSFITSKLSSKVCGLGAFFDFNKGLGSNAMRNLDFNGLLIYNEELDILFGGSLKTLLPNLRFGGDEILYKVWVLVKTPDKKLFPGKLYFGPSGTSFAGWRSSRYAKAAYSADLTSCFNCSPFDLTSDELECLVKALESALRKVPTTDFYGIYQDDTGYYLMGLKRGKCFIFNLGYSYNDINVKYYLESLD